METRRPVLPGDQFVSCIPRLVDGPDFSRFSFDPLTMQMLKLIDGTKPADAIARALGADRRDVMDRLTALETAQLVQITTELVEHAISLNPPAVPPPPPPAPEKGIPAAQPVYAVDYHRPAMPMTAPPAPICEPGPRPSVAPRDTMYNVMHTRSPEGQVAPGVCRKVVDEAVQEKFNGAIVFSTQYDEVMVFFVNGDPEGIQSTSETHEHGLALFTHGKISRSVYEKYKAALNERRARHPVEALKLAGVEDRRELARLVYLRGRIILDELDKWDEGVWYRNPDVAFPANVARCSLLPPAASAMPGAPTTAPAGRPAARPGEKAPAPEKKLTWRETYLTAEQEAHFHSQLPKYISVNREKGRDLATLGLSNREKEYLKAIVEKPMQLSFAMSISPLTRTVTQRMLFQLLQLGVFNMSETNPEGIAEVLPGDLHRYLVEMKMLHEFDVIAAHATSTQEEIERRYQKTIAIFDERYYQNITPEQRADLKEIRRRIEEAAAKLRDPVRRREIRERIWDKLQIDNFYDIQVKKARIALQMRRDGEAALLLASSALELRPHSAEAFGLVNGARQLLRGRSMPPSGG